MCCLLLYSTLFWELSQRFFSFVPLHKWTVRILLLLPRDLSKVLSAVYFPLYYIAGEKAIFRTVLHIFFKPFTICRKNRVLGGVFWKVCAPLPHFCYYAQNILRVFVQEFFCPLTTIFHTFLRNCRNNLSALFLCTKDSSFFCSWCLLCPLLLYSTLFREIISAFTKNFAISVISSLSNPYMAEKFIKWANNQNSCFFK